LETRARIAATDTRGIAREIFARSRGAANARSASFTGKQNDIFLDDGWSRGDFACVRFDHFRFGVFMFVVLVLEMFVFRVFGMFVHDMVWMTESSSVFGAFVSGVSFEFGAIRSAVLFDFFGFGLGEFGFRGDLVFGSVQVCFFLALFLFGFFFRKFSFASRVNFLNFVLFEIGTAD
jgi:hypothetical protein